MSRVSFNNVAVSTNNVAAGFRLSSFRRALLLSAATALTLSSAQAATWTGGAGNDDWFNPNNWRSYSGNPISPSAEAAIIDNGASVMINGQNGSTSQLNLTKGKLTIMGGSVFTLTSNNIRLAEYGGGEATLIVTGTGTSVTMNSTMHIGGRDGGNALLQLADGASLKANTLSIGAETAGSSVFAIGGVEGAAAAGTGTLTLASYGSVLFNGKGTVVFNHTGTDYQFGTAFASQGLLADDSQSVIRHIAGTTTFSADSARFRGGTEVSGGTLYVDGALGGTMDVSGTGTLAGTGTVGRSTQATSGGTVELLRTTTIGNGGTLAPGGTTTIGTMNVAGDLNFEDGSNYRVRIAEDGVSDKTVVGGNLSIDSGANVQVAYDSGITYQSGWKYNILEYGGTLTGQFAAIQDSILLSYALDYSEAGKVGLKISLAGENGGGVVGDWFTPETWTDGIVPDATHTAVIDRDRDIVVDGRTDAVTQNIAFGTADGGGTLTIKNGGKLQAGGQHIFGDYYYAYLGNHVDGPAQIFVQGAGSTLSFINPANDKSVPVVYVGYRTGSSMTISAGGKVIDAESVYFDNHGASSTMLTITGAGSELALSGTGTSPGTVGIKQARIANGGRIDTKGGTITVGRSAIGEHWMEVDGQTTTVDAGTLSIARASPPVGGEMHAHVTVSNGATVTATKVDIASGFASSNSTNTFGTLNIGAAAGEAAKAAGKIVIAPDANPANYSGLTFGQGTGALVFNHTNQNYDFAANIRKDGVPGSASIQHLAGNTTYSGDGSAFVGTTTVSGGTLLVTNNLASTFAVSGTGILGGTGTIGSAAAGTEANPVAASLVTIGNGGTLAPGLSATMGTLNVAGDLAFEAGSTYRMRIAEEGVNDSVSVGGDVTIAQGAKMTVAYGSGITFADGWKYQVLSYGGALTGSFDDIQDSVLLAYTLTHKEDDKALELAIALVDDGSEPSGPDPDATLKPFGKTANQIATAGALDSLGQSNALWLAAASTPDEETVRKAFDQLSGAQHVSTRAAFVQDSRLVREAINNRLRSDDLHTKRDGGERASFWASGFGSWGETEGSNGIDTVDRTVGGFLVGADAPTVDIWRMGVLGGYSNSSFNTALSGTKADTFHFGGYAGAHWEKLAFRSGVHTRGMTFPASAGSVSARC
ncbi:hypothetical protein [Hyphomicrobium sp. D-2]|uniref:hypothetical protein n=1 Tax=Hyphomicrobium sp. D-2 TaxID=3041621 RepID=UPI0024576ECA|nr:hypothetical protein [Hyphomicrobium sp. D-2]MDH4981707.1 hypothetical protein [Hyphomicrobium sp. D-2]